MQDLIIISKVIIIYAIGFIGLCGFCGLMVVLMSKPKQIKKVIHSFNSNKQVKNKRVA